LPAIRCEASAAAGAALGPQFWDSGWQPGEAGAQECCEAFVEGAAHGYAQQRELPGRIGSSRLSPHLHFGELSPRQALAAVRGARAPPVPAADRERFAIELGWREFAVQTLLANPDYGERELDPGFRHFRWASPDPTKLRAWQRGHTGVPLVDAGMRELWQTGWMHNRVRMVVASFLTKNLRYHWSLGARWFWDTLLDADLANNSQGWQWTAGTGADAAPYLRVFNPARQGERFDPRGDYVRRWLPELARLPDKALHAPWQQPAEARRLAPDYPAAPIVDLAASRLEALRNFRCRRDVGVG
jgi:deoxyribodipyrimidine photo-lyase